MEDLISRQAAIDIASGYCHPTNIAKELAKLPSVQPERKKGKWERHNTYHGDDTSGFVDPDWRCSECGEQANVNVWSMYDLTNYCPNCGADMRQEGEEHGTDI